MDAYFTEHVRVILKPGPFSSSSSLGLGTNLGVHVPIDYDVVCWYIHVCVVLVYLCLLTLP